MTKLHAMNLFIFKILILSKTILMSFAMMYIFVHCIYMRYMDACIHEGLNLQLHGATSRP
jgi:hypothetical protein